MVSRVVKAPMPMWDISRPASPVRLSAAAQPGACQGQRVRGFSLLEILVVLLLTALVAGVALPRVVAIYDSVQFASERDELLDQLASLGQMRLNAGEPLQILAEEDLRRAGLEPPEAWRITVLEPLVLRANGSCTEGMLSLAGRGRVATVRLVPPFCRPEVVNDGV